MGLITIPGNIKQQYLPFVLNPKNKLNSNVENSEALDKSGSGAQCFSFRRKSYASEYKAGFGLLNICPSSFREKEFGNFLKKDISFRTLYNQINKDTGKSDRKSITADDLFNALPGIQIREYLPDTRLDQCFNLFGDMLTGAIKTLLISAGAPGTGVVDLLKWAVKGGIGELLADPDKLDKLKLSMGYITDWLISNPTFNKSNLLFKNGNLRFSLPGNYQGVYMDKSGLLEFDDTKVLTLPYTLYYRLQSCVTTNVYELPCKIETAFDVNGKEGWGGGGMGIENTFVKKIPGLGDFLQNMFSNVRINFMKWWDSESGSKTPEPSVQVKFCLFNDTAERAMMNFIFINTIAPNNMWVQYGLFQHSSSIYDIKVEGHSRLYACAGKVKVDYKGVLRNPPPGWVKTLVYKYGNGDSEKTHGCISHADLYANIQKNNLIKIPDVYEVTLTFDSMLPQNLNTYLYRYAENANIENQYMDGSVYQASEIHEFILADEMAEDLQEYNDKQRDTDLAAKRKNNDSGDVNSSNGSDNGGDGAQ